MHPSKLSRSELIASLGGILLLVGVFLPWYVPNTENRNAVVAGSREAVSAWEAHTLLRFFFIAAAIAPLILAYIVIRDHELSWPRGELTAVVAIAAFGIIGYVGIVDRPGEPPGEISLGIGWFLSMAGVILMAIGGAMRAGGSEQHDHGRDGREQGRSRARSARGPHGRGGSAHALPLVPPHPVEDTPGAGEAPPSGGHYCRRS